MRRMGLRGVVAGFGIVVGLLTACDHRAPSPTESSAPLEDVEVENIALNSSTSIDVERTVRMIWWNQKKYVASLELTDEQRRLMDEVLVEFLKIWPENTKYRRTAQSRLMKALREGDLDRAAAVVERNGEAAKAVESGMLRLKSEVYQILSESQRDIVAEEHRRLFLRRWVSSGRVSSGE